MPLLSTRAVQYPPPDLGEGPRTTNALATTFKNARVSTIQQYMLISALCAQSDYVPNVDMQKQFFIYYQNPFNVPIFVLPLSS